VNEAERIEELLMTNAMLRADLDGLRAAAMGTMADLVTVTDLLREAGLHDVADLTAASYRALREAGGGLRPGQP
jgi:hypothetical protein